MAHIQIKAGADVTGTAQVLVDGINLTNHILADGFTINCPGHPEGVWSVTMTVIADPLDVDLPNAVIEAVRSEAMG